MNSDSILLYLGFCGGLLCNLVIVGVIIFVIFRATKKPKEDTAEMLDEPASFFPEDKTRKCPKCGTENLPENNFCKQCGAKLPA